MSRLRRTLALIVLAFVSALVMLGTVAAVSAPASVAQTMSETIGSGPKCC
jgi:hypothetical protein